MSLNTASCISTMNSFKGSTGVNEFKITCLGIMDFIDVNIRDGTNVIQAQIFSTYIFHYYTGFECTLYSNGHSNITWFLRIRNKQLFGKDMIIYKDRVRVQMTNEQKFKFSFERVVDDNTISTELSFNVLSKQRKIQFIKPVDALLIEGT